MDTKWKNNKSIIKEFLKNNYKLFIAVVLMVIGCIFFYALLMYHSYYVTTDAWLLTVCGNVAWLLGEALLWSGIIRYKLKDFLPEDETCYEQWKQRKKQHIQRLQIISLVEWIIACAYLFLLTYERRYGGYYSVSNYASGYAMIITVLNQYIACRWAISHEMQRKMDDCMQYMANVSKERIDQALEIEREGLKKAMEIERQSMEKVSRSDQLRIDLITNVSHDIKTPLTSIINYVDLLTKEDVENPKVQEYLEVLTRQSARLKKLIEDLIEASKASSGVLKVNWEKCVPEVLLTQAAGEYEERLEQKNLELVIHHPQEELVVLADGRHLWRVFDNLLSNIYKYAQPGTRVYLDLEQDEKNVSIIFRNVSKNPLHMSGEELQERFVRGDSSRNTEGSGLGLSIARSLTELMHGSFHLLVDGDFFKVTLTFPHNTENA